MVDNLELREEVRERYAKAATSGSCCGPECCGHDETLEKDLTDGAYTPEELSVIPAEASDASLGCGNPTAVADLSEGDRVLDLGRGAASTSCSQLDGSDRPGIRLRARHD